MKTLFATFVFMCLATVAFASPFLVCDPQPGQEVDYYVVTGLTGADGSHVAKDTTGTYGFKLDLSALAAGTYTVRAKACNDSWGVCSADSSPFVFSRPSTLTAPGVFRLSK
jgi:hypothetical protein